MVVVCKISVMMSLCCLFPQDYLRSPLEGKVNFLFVSLIPRHQNVMGMEVDYSFLVDCFVFYT